MSQQSVMPTRRRGRKQLLLWGIAALVLGLSMPTGCATENNNDVEALRMSARNTASQHDHAEPQEQALEEAQRIIDESPTTPSLLQDALKEQGFTDAHAEYALDNVEVDWQQQAVAVAGAWLAGSGFSKQGLHDGLANSGFTAEQATYAVDQQPVDWAAQAERVAKALLAANQTSERGELIQMLTERSFTAEEAASAATKVGLHVPVSVTASTAGEKDVGDEANVWGKVNGHTGDEVWTEVFINNAWSRSQSGTTDETGAYSLPLTYGLQAPGVYTFRVGAKTPGGSVYSPQVMLKRTMKAPALVPAPEKKPAVTPPKKTPKVKKVYYKNCTEARKAGVTPIYRGEPGYAKHLDRDGDGIACE